MAIDPIPTHEKIVDENGIMTRAMVRFLSGLRGTTQGGLSVEDVQKELDDTQAGAGLGVLGQYIAPIGTNYLNLSTSLAVADVLLDTAIKDTLTENTIPISSESDFTIINIGGTDYNLLEDNKRYLLRKVITFTRGFAASGAYSGTIDIFSTVSAAHIFNNVNCIFYGDALNKFSRLFIRQVSITGTPDSSLFNKNHLTPSEIRIFNFDDGIIDGIEMGSLKGGVVFRFSNIQNQKSTWDIDVTGVIFLNITNVSVVGNQSGGGTSFGGSHIKIRGVSGGAMQIVGLNIIPADSDTMYDLTELDSPLDLTNNIHLDLLNSGGLYGAGTDKTITAFADAGGGQVTVTSANHNIPSGNFVDITGTTSYNGNFKITNVTTNTFEITDTFVSDDATGTINATVVNQTDPLVFAVGSRGTDNPDSQIIGSLGWVSNTTATVLSGSNWFNAAGTTYELENERCSQTANNELTFTNIETRKVKISLSLIVVAGSGGGSPTFEFRMLKNGSPLQLNGIDIITKVDTSTSIPRFAGVLTTTSAVVDDVFILQVRNVTNNNNVTVTDGSMIID